MIHSLTLNIAVIGRKETLDAEYLSNISLINLSIQGSLTMKTILSLCTSLERAGPHSSVWNLSQTLKLYSLIQHWKLRQMESVEMIHSVFLILLPLAGERLGCWHFRKGKSLKRLWGCQMHVSALYRLHISGTYLMYSLQICSYMWPSLWEWCVST